MILGSSMLKETPTCLPTFLFLCLKIVKTMDENHDQCRAPVDMSILTPGGSQGNGRQQTEESLASMDCMDIIIAVYVRV